VKNKITSVQTLNAQLCGPRHGREGTNREWKRKRREVIIK
jgi:hypothetical protein